MQQFSRMSNSTVLTLVVFAVERYVVVSNPFKARQFDKIKRSIGIVVVIWVIAIVSALPILFIGPHLSQIYLNGTKSSKSDCLIPNSITCDIYNEFPDYPADSFDPFFIYSSISTLVFFVFAMILISVLYTRIAIRLRRPSFTRRVEESLNNRVISASRRSSINNPNIIRLLGQFYKSKSAILAIIIHFQF